jgi:bifunctional non-homologous end joining protein LigD
VYGVCSREHEPKHDGWRLIAIIAGDGPVKLLSRQRLDHTTLFRAPFRELAASGRPMVLDGEIAVPDDRGITHIGALNDAIATRRPDRLAYFAFDLLHLDHHDLRRCPIEQRKATLRQVIDDVGCDRMVFVDHVVGRGKQLFDKVREMGGEGVVSKRLGRPYRGGESRDWLKSKVSEIGRFVITGSFEFVAGCCSRRRAHVAAVISTLPSPSSVSSATGNECGVVPFTERGR